MNGNESIVKYTDPEHVNLILFETEELEINISKGDPRMQHVKDTLGMGLGDRFDMGIPNGPRGKALIVALNDDSVDLRFELEDSIPNVHPIHLICSYTRPAAAGRILREMTTLGLASMSFFIADKAEKSYASSKIWKEGEYHRFLVEGAEQAFSTRIPKINLCSKLEEAFEFNLGRMGLALDNYEASRTLASLPVLQDSLVFAVGPERGWSAIERIKFRHMNFELMDLGERVLRSDTACIAGASVLISKLSKM